MFSYLGGKKFQAKWISGYFPKHDTYVEPFGGAFWVYFVGNINVNNNVYNDYNRYLTNVFHCAKNNRSEFIKQLKSYKPQLRNLFEKFHNELVPLTYDVELGDVETASKYMYIETQTFSGLTIEKAKFVDLKGIYKSKYEQFIDKLENPKYTNKIDNITNIENLSYADCIKKYDSKYTFFYCDPPYFNMEDYYTKEFGHDEHLKLSETLKSIKGKFALSYYDFPLLSKWFPKSKYNWQEKAFNRQNSSKKVGTAKGKEILILNY